MEQGESMESKDTEAAAGKSSHSATVDVMKAYSVRLKAGGEKVYGGGGIFIGRMPDGKPFRMVPGQVRTLPRQVVDRYNQMRKIPIFVTPGSQIEGEPIAGAAQKKKTAS